VIFLNIDIISDFLKAQIIILLFNIVKYKWYNLFLISEKQLAN